uniref:BZIP domain-containing protein n=1 Tax=Bursaphelenchus xylophilus TaxID=6326 RepID=A0A1I7S1S4_BURXY
MDESMEPSTSRSDPNIDLPAMEVSSENGPMEKRKKGLEKARENRNQKKRINIKLAENFRKVPLNFSAPIVGTARTRFPFHSLSCKSSLCVLSGVRRECVD